MNESTKSWNTTYIRTIYGIRMTGLTCYPVQSSVATKQSILRLRRHHFSLLSTNTLKHNYKNSSNNATESDNPEIVKTVEDLNAMRESIRENTKAAQTWMLKYYNQKVANKELQFKVGDWVMVNANNIKTKRLSKKLAYKLKGKFEIENLYSTNAYRLYLLYLFGKMHLVFHVSLLKPYPQNPIP